MLFLEGLPLNHEGTSNRIMEIVKDFERTDRNYIV